MVKHYQVFVSSTYEDLREERAEVIQALLELDCIPSGMELFPAGDEEQWTVIKRVIDECDYYIVIIAGRYGSIGADGKSYTQMEYEYAVSTGKPVMAFLHANPGLIPANRTEQDQAKQKSLEAFRELAKNKMYKPWTSPKDLAGVVSRGVARMRQDRPSIGWVRANLVADESAAQEILRLKNRIDELEKSLADLRLMPPPGTEQLAQGDEDVVVKYEQRSLLKATQEYGFTTTWNQLFSILAPLMIDGAAERDLLSALNKYIYRRIGYPDEAQRATVEVLNDEFQKVKVQFRALGLITKDEKRRRNIRDTDTYWTLTPYGDKVMTDLMAVRK